MSKEITRVRNPKAPPHRNLEDSVNFVKTIYDNYHHTSFARTEVASVLKLSANSGYFSSVINSLRMYDFLENDNDGFKITELFKSLKVANQGSNEFKKYAFQAIKSVPLFDELLDDFKHKLPPLRTITQRLEIQKKMSPFMAKNTAKVFEDSVNFAGVLDANRNILPIRENDDNKVDLEEKPAKEDAYNEIDMDLNNRSSSIYTIHISGPGKKLSFNLSEVDDLDIVDSVMKKIRKDLEKKMSDT